MFFLCCTSIIHYPTSLDSLQYTLTRDADFSAASPSNKNVVILLKANPPTSAEAPDPADRFRFRFPD